MNTRSDFFLASSESYAFRGPFKCWVEGTVTGALRNDYLLVRIEPPAIDYRTKEPIEKILVAGRNSPTSLRKLPASVYVAIVKDASVYKSLRCDASNIEIVTTADTFSTFEAAAGLAKSAQ